MNYRRPIAMEVAMLGVTVCVWCAPAQVRGTHSSATPRAGVFAPAPRTSFPFRSGLRSPFTHLRHRWFYPGWGYWSSPYFPDYDYDYDYDYYDRSATTSTPPQQVIVVEDPVQPATPPKPPELLVLEHQGDQWVRLGLYGQSPTRAQSTQPDSEQASNPPSSPAERTEVPPVPSVLPAAILVFRDGHKEEVKKYMITVAALYTRADYWSTGSWTRKVPIDQLDVPVTMKLNEERGASFRLPSGPNEVVIRL